MSIGSTNEAQRGIREFLAGLQIVDEDLVVAWSGISETRHFDKSRIVLHAGERPKHFHLVLEGVVRYYYSPDDGRERNKAFFHEGGLIGSLSAIYNDGPAPFSIDAVVPIRLVTTPVAPYLALIERCEGARTMLERYTSRLFIRNELREAMLLTRDMEGRYRWVVDHEPWLFDRVPQYQIASYLGMDPVSLSRLKQRAAGKPMENP